MRDRSRRRAKRCQRRARWCQRFVGLRRKFDGKVPLDSLSRDAIFLEVSCEVLLISLKDCDNSLGELVSQSFFTLGTVGGRLATVFGRVFTRRSFVLVDRFRFAPKVGPRVSNNSLDLIDREVAFASLVVHDSTDFESFAFVHVWAHVLGPDHHVGVQMFSITGGVG